MRFGTFKATQVCAVVIASLMMTVGFGGTASAQTTISTLEVTVVDANGPVEGVVIDQFYIGDDGLRGRWYGYKISDANGEAKITWDRSFCEIFTLTAPAGRTWPNGSQWNNQSICIGEGATEQLQVSLDGNSDVASLKGSITDTNGDPVDGMIIELFQANADGSRGTYVRATNASASGLYSFDVEPGCYVVTFVSPGGTSDDRVFVDSGSRWLNRAACASDGPVENVDAVLTASSPTSISGFVDDQSRTGVEGIAVDLFDVQTGPAAYVTSTVTDASGAFTFDVAPSCYNVVFTSPQADTNRATFAESRSFWQRRYLCVDSGENSPPVSATLDAGAPFEVTTMAYDSPGVPLTRGEVGLWTADENNNRLNYVRGDVLRGAAQTFPLSAERCYAITFTSYIEPWDETDSRWLTRFFCTEAGVDSYQVEVTRAN